MWVPQLEVFYGANIPSWTLAVEAFFYVLLPLALVAAWRLPERWLWRAVLLVGALMTAWAAAVGLVISDAVTITDGTPLSRNQLLRDRQRSRPPGSWTSRSACSLRAS